MEFVGKQGRFSAAPVVFLQVPPVFIISILQNLSVQSLTVFQPQAVDFCDNYFCATCTVQYIQASTLIMTTTGRHICRYVLSKGIFELG